METIDAIRMILEFKRVQMRRQLLRPRVCVISESFKEIIKEGYSSDFAFSKDTKAKFPWDKLELFGCRVIWTQKEGIVEMY